MPWAHPVAALPVPDLKPLLVIPWRSACIFLAFLLLPSLRGLSPGTLPRVAAATIDPTLFFSVSLCILTGVIFGIGPALQSSRKVIQSALQEGGRGSSQGGNRARFQSALVIAEMAIALVLIAARVC